MKTCLSRNLSSLTALGKASLIVASIASGPSWAFDPERSWTTVGSAGTVDESSTDVRFHLNHASLVSKAGEFSSGKIRYNVTAVDNLFSGGFPIMKFTYIDNGPSARVSARLIRTDLKNGAGKTILRFDSNDFPETNRRQQQEVTPACNAFLPFDFENYAYFIEVSLVQDNRTSDKASLEAIQIKTEICIS